ncbi:MAG: universal stress protein [Acidimicrobiia bacterium]
MKIVVPLDLSDTAAKAIEPAMMLAKALGDELMLVTVSGLRLRSDLQEQAKSEQVEVPEMIESYLRSVASDVDGIPADYSLISGDDAAEALVNYAGAEDVRMVVMATHGRSGFERWKLGSIAERVVRHSPVPVTVIPTRKPGWE